MLEKFIAVLKNHKIKLAVAAVLIAGAFVANALYIPSRVLVLPNGVKLTLTAKKCDVPNVLEAVNPQYIDRLKLVLVSLPKDIAERIGKADLRACVIEEDGQVVGMDELGNTFQFPAKDFQ